MWRAAEMAVEYVHQLTVDVEIPSMQELGFSEDEIPMLADKAFADPQTIGNPRDVNAAGYRKIYEQAFRLGKAWDRHPLPLTGAQMKREKRVLTAPGAQGSGVRGTKETGVKMQ